MTRAQLKTNIRSNLADLGVTRFSDVDLNESLQDAYDDVAILTQCVTKRVTLNWISDLSYYNFVSLGVSDYLCTLAIFNNVTNWFLRDDLTIRDFDKIRLDWEKWNGTPLYWAPCGPFKVAIAAKYIGNVTLGAFNPFAFTNAFYIGSYPNLGSFELCYAATAPVFTSDSDTPLIAMNMQNTLEQYVTADLLEQDEEFGKAQDWWEAYYANVEDYKKRVHRINKSDLLLRL